MSIRFGLKAGCDNRWWSRGGVGGGGGAAVVVGGGLAPAVVVVPHNRVRVPVGNSQAASEWRAVARGALGLQRDT
jgi:hypothetical protein